MVACPVWVDKEKVSGSSAWPAAAAVFLGGRVSDVCGGWQEPAGFYLSKGKHKSRLSIEATQHVAHALARSRLLFLRAVCLFVDATSAALYLFNCCSSRGLDSHPPPLAAPESEYAKRKCDEGEKCRRRYRSEGARP